MTTHGDIVLSYPYQPFNRDPLLTVSLTSSLTNSTIPTSVRDSPLHMRTDQNTSSKHPVSDQHIPSSVKGAPAHLRQVIRKRQNSESAKRSRQRRKEAARRFYQRFDQQCKRISTLEKRVAQLVTLVKQNHKIDQQDQPMHEENATDYDKQKCEQVVTLQEEQKPDLSLLNDKCPLASSVPLDIINDQQVQVSHAPDFCKAGATSFEEDLEALLDSCFHTHFGDDNSPTLGSYFGAGLKLD